MYVLGLNVGHNSTSALLKNGRIVYCVSEERFSRVKNHFGIPYQSIDFILKEEKIDKSKIDLIVVDDQYLGSNEPLFGDNFINSYKNRKPINKIFSFLGYKYPSLFFKYYSLKNYFFYKTERKRKYVINYISEKINFPKEKIICIDHHLAHALSCCFNLKKGEKTLIFTLDGEGSNYCASVNLCDGKGIKVLSKSKKTASLGYLYAIATLYLGMKPMQHEFKVMGLAPYAKEHNIDKIYKKFEELFFIDDNLEFKSKFSMPFSDWFFFEKMRYERFDSIAGAVQRLTENLTCNWIKKTIEKTGVKNIALSGGVFMNVKANQKISELKEVEKIFVMPSCGDEVNAIGCCFFGFDKFLDKNNLEISGSEIDNLYLGPEYNDEYIKNLIDRLNLKDKYNITKPKSLNKFVANLLSKGEIVARCSGKSEWGARALGNRSILANPKHPETIKILNETIKDRDFWMPFTPTIIDIFEKKYILNNKKINASFMSITFNSKESAKEDLPAAMHPYDHTIRPQILTRKQNPDYYEIIYEFSRLTGIGAVLNTSFNLHGEPNVLTPEDALHTLDNSSLKYLAIGDYLFQKKK